MSWLRTAMDVTIAQMMLKTFITMMIRCTFKIRPVQMEMEKSRSTAICWKPLQDCVNKAKKG